MRRVLSECSASVRKSFQGLDYFAAEGARAFDNLISLVRQVGFLGPGHDWEKKGYRVSRNSEAISERRL